MASLRISRRYDVSQPLFEARPLVNGNVSAPSRSITVQRLVTVCKRQLTQCRDHLQTFTESSTSPGPSTQAALNHCQLDCGLAMASAQPPLHVRGGEWI